ncbi:PQQ-binding-like beta-propeller repeat protein [Mucilaginibacter rubeus]|uniref:PQQ-binding-like beta-propeller repeat protein n=1 Tax=Mucilaginibacter rubeus TaxID=2027860 RepID=A0AAE6MI89_9SPHI|nr:MULTISPECIES: PQQ-binding-like beta-propeller repeat protein [Mucilaginibacter]QEM04338.1 PQQ-binding-like beta-propeller repeat protein [Mucilaginibacter rubeus]QEM16937.1 PQQ-binding-like beta-propeller repeat protein [Mucilaginibacter gossypii]QTE46571.1 PQQ-binding-like beta-propeller repeat protein [Mucilaginibacter rubeus]QTE53168.1 PQQ-binding-like beta-propeller repeat protein [Mucilaginibacter rubeus]QTE58256.1 PQQ-binding-like beta-propeller repeat protein [Mucilaginibacter rubeus
MINTRYLIALCFAAGIYASCKNQQGNQNNNYSGWPAYAGSKEGVRYSSNDEITLNNVNKLKVMWTFSTGDRDTANLSQNQCNPIMVDGILYGTSPKLKLFALNAVTGLQKWLFDPAKDDTTNNGDPMAYYKVSRGVIYWQNDNGGEKRIFYSVGAKTWAIDAENGTPVRSFGKGGYLDLTKNLDRDTKSFVAGTTPGVVYKDVLIVGDRVSESADAAPGHVRAYDARTGKLKWIFHTIPHPGEVGYNTWKDTAAYKKFGGANNWAGMALDEKRGIVYIPTGSVGGDFYGGFRKGQNLFANSLLALDAATGKLKWYYQFVHHDLWDRDLPANPNLVTIVKDGKKVDAVTQITKHGYVFMFDRTTGKPIFPIVETPVPTKALPGEEVWPTQPIPTLPQPFARQMFNPEDVTDRTPEVHREMLSKYNQVKNRNMFTPPSKEGGWIFPGFDGGGEWGGAAVDPESKILYVNCSEMPWAQVMIDVPKTNTNDHSPQALGHVVYNTNCIGCHGAELKGNGTSYPSLVNIGKKYTADQVSGIIAAGRNMMPSFKQISPTDKKNLLAFLLKIPETKGAKEVAKEPTGNRSASSEAEKKMVDEVPYAMNGYNRFLDNDGYPGIKPPWGTLNAINLTSGKLLWKVPLGEYPELTQKGIPVTGTENYGGPVVTKGGLIFIAATKDEKIRAFDKRTGKVVWEANLPAAGYATPATYSIDGKQYIVIACGGGKIGSKSGDSYVCFGLTD